MKNIILTAACGLQPEPIEFFLKSLRSFYKDSVFVLINKKDHKIKEYLRKYNCEFLEVNTHKFDIQIKRYNYYLNILNQKKYQNVLICDSRDIYFQSNPFEYNFKGNINFFLEDKKIAECPFNKNWIIKTYGVKVFNNLSQKIINCSGTTLGDSNAIKEYLNLIINHSKKYKYKKRLKYIITFRRDKNGRGVDQAYANFIVHNNLIKNSYLYSNKTGPIATVYYLQKINFNEDNKLINSLNEPYSIVHQYDKRWDEFKENVKIIKRKLNIV